MAVGDPKMTTCVECGMPIAVGAVREALGLTECAGG